MTASSFTPRAQNDAPQAEGREPDRRQPSGEPSRSRHLGWLFALGSVALLLLCLVAGGAFLLMRAGFPASLLPTATWTPQPTVAPTATATPTPTPSVITSATAAQVRPLAVWGKGKIAQMALAPDGHLVAAASFLGVYLYQLPDLEEVAFFDTPVPATCVVFSPDGRLVAAGLQDGTAQVWRLSDGQMLHHLQGDVYRVSTLAFSPDGSLLALGGSEGELEVWQVKDGILLQPLKRHSSEVFSVAFSPDGTLLASGSWKRMRLWRVDQGTLVREEEIGDMVNDLAFSPDGALLAAATGNYWGINEVRLWQVSDGTLVKTLVGERGYPMLSVAFSPDGTLLAAGTYEAAEVWRLADGALVSTLAGKKKDEEIYDVTFSADGKTLFSRGSKGFTIYQWQIADGTLLRSLALPTEGAVFSVAFSPDGTLLASGHADHWIRLWRVADGTLWQSFHHDLTENRRVIFALPWLRVSFSPQGDLLASTSENGTMRLWKMPDGQDAGSGEGWATGMVFSPDGRLLAGAGGRVVGVLSLERGKMVYLLKGHEKDVNAVAFSPDGKILASGADDATVRLWRVSNGSLLRTLDKGEWIVLSLAFSPDGTLLAAGTGDDISLWRVADGSLVRTLKDERIGRGGVESVAFSPDGTLLAASADSAILLWRVADGTLLQVLEGHQGAVHSLAFSPDGTLLASGSEDGTVRLWGLEEVGK